MEEEAARRRGGVDGIGEALELHTLLVKLAYQVYEMLDAAAEPVKFTDHKRVAVAQRFLRFEKPRPLGSAAADFVLKDFFATCFGEGFSLEFKILFQGGDTRVSDQHEVFFRSSPNSLFLELIENTI